MKEDATTMVLMASMQDDSNLQEEEEEPAPTSGRELGWQRAESPTAVLCSGRRGSTRAVLCSG